MVHPWGTQLTPHGLRVYHGAAGCPWRTRLDE
jgi:hypothetical protein